MRLVLVAVLVVVGCTKGDGGATDTGAIPTGTATGTATGTGTGSTQTTGDGDAWFCSTDSPTVTDLGNGYQQVDTQHYTMQLAVTPERALELGHLAEAAWLAMSDRFGAEPAEPVLEVGLYPDRASFEGAILDDGVTPPPGAGGYYSTASKQAYALVPPTRYYEDIIVLHEMLHQFHYLSSTGNLGIPEWYAEGLAETWSRHDWDDRCLRMGRIPLVSQEDLYGIARQQLEADGLDLTAVVTGAESPTRAMAMAIFAYIEDTDPDGLVALRAELDAHTSDPLGAFQTHLGDPAVLQDQVVTWIADHQEPMNPVYLEWIHRTPTAVETLFVDGVLSMTLAKESGDLSATIVPRAEPWIGGLLIGFEDTDNYTVALTEPGGEVSVFEVGGGTVDWFSVGTITPPEYGPVSLELTHSGGTAQISINGESVSHPLVHAEARGLAVYGTNLRFEDIALP